MQFDPDLERLRFALAFMTHELNAKKKNIIDGADVFFAMFKNVVHPPAKIVRSPSRLPVDPRYATKKARAANMIPFGPARRTRQATRRNASISS